MAAKLCTNCGGIGRVFVSGYDPMKPFSMFCEERSIICTVCNGLGYTDL